MLDRLARWFEGGGRGAPVDRVVDLEEIVGASALEELSERVSAFYAEPHRFHVRVRVEAAPRSRFLLAVSALLARQTDLPVGEAGSSEWYPVGQLVYRDARGRIHWDRYALVQGAWRRLFVARVAPSARRLVETFVIYGVPVALPFEARVEDGALALSLARSLFSPLTWIASVEYRTEASDDDEIHTRGDFQIPVLRFRARTEFRARPREPFVTSARTPGERRESERESA